MGRLATLLPCLMMGCQISTPPPVTIEFLGFQGCPHSPTLRGSLDEAIGQMPALSGVTVAEIDLMSLPEGDARLAWGAPTILLDGEDLFGQPPGEDRRLSCRLWPGGTAPTTQQVRDRLLEACNR